MEQKKELIDPQLTEPASNSSQEEQKLPSGRLLSRREALCLGLGGIGAAAVTTNELRKQAPWGIASLFRNGLSTLSKRVVQNLTSPVQASTPDTTSEPKLDISKFPIYHDPSPKRNGVRAINNLEISPSVTEPLWIPEAETFGAVCKPAPLGHPKESIRMRQGIIIYWVPLTFQDKPVSTEDLNNFRDIILPRSQVISDFYQHFLGVSIENKFLPVQGNTITLPKPYVSYSPNADLFADIGDQIIPLITDPKHYTVCGLITLLDMDPWNFGKFGLWGGNAGSFGVFTLSQDTFLVDDMISKLARMHEPGHAIFNMADVPIDVINSDPSTKKSIMYNIFSDNLPRAVLRRDLPDNLPPTQPSVCFGIRPEGFLPSVIK